MAGLDHRNARASTGQDYKRFRGPSDLPIAQACSHGPFDGAWGPFYRNSATRLCQITDGLSQTLMMGERQNGPFRVPGVHGPHFEYETTWSGAVRDIDDPADCLRQFRSNRVVGWLLFASIIAGHFA